MRPLLLAAAALLCSCSEKGISVYGTPPSASITAPPDGSAFGDGSYDYNCDGSQSRLYTDPYDCAWELDGISLDCDGSGGWADGTVAGCGDRTDWGTGCEFTVDIDDLLALVLGGGEPTNYCTYTGTSSRTQECR